MSHFTVLVITPTKPTDEELSAVLQPWHEYECTGTNDQYVVDVDKTAEALEAFADATTTRFRDASGVLHDPFDGSGNWKPEFSKEEADPHLPSLKRRVKLVPEGYEEVEIPASQAEPAAEWIKGYYGWEVIGPNHTGELPQHGSIQLAEDGSVAKCVDRTNPNAKWDWWVVGGRWAGLLRLKPGATGTLGRPGVFGYPEEAHKTGASDQARKGDVDFEALWAEGAQEGGEYWDRVQKVAGHLPAPITWEQAREQAATGAERDSAYWDRARALYNGQPAVKAIQQEFKDWFDTSDMVGMLTRPREDVVLQYRNGKVCSFAYVRDGEWYERGSMGWWGSVSGDKNKADWNAHFAQLLAELPDDYWLTNVDCHI